MNDRTEEISEARRNAQMDAYRRLGPEYRQDWMDELVQVPCIECAGLAEVDGYMDSSAHCPNCHVNFELV